MTDNTIEYMTVSMCGADALDWCGGYNEAVTKANEIINLQKAEIERLETNNLSMQKTLSKMSLGVEQARAEARAKAIKDFAERLTHTLVINNEENTEIFDFSYTLETINNLVKEMIGEQQ